MTAQEPRPDQPREPSPETSESNASAAEPSEAAVSPDQTPTPASESEAGASTDQTDVASLREELQKATARAEELSGRWQRTQADFVNYKRRAEQERAGLTKFANLTLIARILPVLDDLDRAMATLPKELHQLTWIEGVAIIHRKLQFILEQEGLAPIEAEGKDLDPNVHEVVMSEEGVDLHEAQVVSELQRGYRIHDRVLRPALVKVGRRPAQTGKE